MCANLPRASLGGERQILLGLACEAELRAQRYSNWEWLEPSGELRMTTSCLPALRAPADARDAPDSFFNSMVAAYTGWNDSRNVGRECLLLGAADEHLLSAHDLDACAHALDDAAVAFAWQAGDVLLVDNRRTLHSRRPFTGPRKVLASLATLNDDSPRWRAP